MSGAIGIPVALIFVLVTAIHCVPAHAGTVPAWAGIPKPERRLLAPWAHRWAHLPRWRKRQLLKRVDHWMRLTPVERNRVLRNLKRWRRLSPRARARIRRAYRQFRGLPQWRQRQLLDRWKLRAHRISRPPFPRMGHRGGHIPHGLFRQGHIPHGGRHRFR